MNRRNTPAMTTTGNTAHKNDLTPTDLIKTSPHMAGVAVRWVCNVFLCACGEKMDLRRR